MNRTNLRRMFLTCAAVAAMAAAGVLAQSIISIATASDWPEFRGGERRNGRSGQKGLLQKWPEGGPKLLWSVTGIGRGFTSVSVADGLIYVTGLKGKEGALSAFTLDGKLKWEANYGDEYLKDHQGVHSIPTVREGLVYVTSGVGNLACFNAADGKPVWSRKVFEEYDAPQVKWGYAESVLVDGNKVIMTPCGKRGTMVALDRKTGKPLWASPALGHESSFCSPILVEWGTRMIVTITDSAVVAFSPADGSVLWQHPYKNARQNHCDSPVYAGDGLLYVTSGYGKGAIGLQMAEDGRSVKQIWEQPKQDPVHGQAVSVDGYVYASSHQSIKGKWSCVELKTGKLMWEDPCVGSGGSVIYADGMLYCYSEDGVVGLVRPNPAKCEVVSSFKVPLGADQHWAHPAISGGRLYIRHGDALMCYDISAEKK